MYDAGWFSVENYFTLFRLHNMPDAPHMSQVFKFFFVFVYQITSEFAPQASNLKAHAERGLIHV